MRITTLEEIQQQAEPEIIELPGWKAGMSLIVRARLIDLSPLLLQIGIGNPLLASMREDESPQEIVKRASPDMLERMLPILDTVAEQALVEPTYADITAIQPLTLEQKLKVLEFAMGGESLLSLSGAGATGAISTGGAQVASPAVDVSARPDESPEVSD